jgi:hypothetical protein
LCIDLLDRAWVREGEFVWRHTNDGAISFVAFGEGLDPDACYVVEDEPVVGQASEEGARDVAQGMEE